MFYLNIPYDEIKSLVLQYLKGETTTSYHEICAGVASIALSRKIVPPQPTEFGVTHPGGNSLGEQDSETVREIVWDLIVQRVLTIGMNNANPNWPWLKLTAYGKTVTNTNGPVPHDPSGYLFRVRQEVPNIDPVILTYLEESINTYSIGAYLSASVTLGCASEKALLLLIDSYINSIKDDKERESFRHKVQGRVIKRQYDEFSKALTGQLGKLPNDLSDNLNNILLGVFDMIRINRNEVGHPTGKTVEKEVIFAYLQVFIGYCKRIYGLISYYASFHKK
jgi:hypothetical protein